MTGKPLIIRNDIFGADHECLTGLRRHFTAFTVTRSTARTSGPEALAYPDEFYGCDWGKCTEGTILPERARLANRIRTAWLTRAGRPAGEWNASYDIWLSVHRHISGQAAGAELMIWPRTTFPRPPASRPVVSIGGVRYWYQHWRPCHVVRGHRHCWNYIQFRRVRPALRVAFRLGPFLRFSERHGLIRSWWWLSSVAAGFEIWKGGNGLGTVRFSVTSAPRSRTA